MIRQSLLYLFIRAGTGAFAIATMTLFSRSLSPGEYGVYALGVAIATVASAVLFQWIAVAVGRFYPMHRNDPEIIMTAAARGFWAATAAAVVLSLAALPFLSRLDVAPALLGILFLSTVALGRHNLELQLANAQRAPMRFGLLSWTKSGGGLLVGLVLIHSGAGERGALLGFLAGLVLAVLAFNTKPKLRMKFGSIGTRTSIDFFRYGLPLTLNSLAIVIVDVADRFMIASLLGTAEVGPYAIAYDFVLQTIGPIMNVLSLAAFPLVVHALEAEGDAAALPRLRTFGFSLIGLGLPAAVGLGILSDEVSELLFGGDFSKEAAMVMPWLAIAFFIACFKNYYLDMAFQLRNVTKYQGQIAVGMAVVNIALNFILLPIYGILGAALATLFAFIFGAIISWRVGRQVFPLPSMGNIFAGSACACATMAIAIYSLPPAHGPISLLAKIVFGIVIYIMTTLVINVYDCRGLLTTILSRRFK